MSKWTTILTAGELEALYASIAKLDPRFAAESRKFWESRTASQLEVLAHQSWLCNDAEAYQIARSLLALKEAAHV